MEAPPSTVEGHHRATYRRSRIGLWLFKLIDVYIEHGVAALDCYRRAPRLRETIEAFTDEPGSIAANRTGKMFPLHLGGIDTQTHVLPTIQSQFSDINLSFVSQQATASQVIDDAIRKLSFENTELDGEAGFTDVVGSGVDTSGLSHDESFGVDDMDLNLNEPIVGRTQEPIVVAEVNTQVSNVEDVGTQVPIVEEFGTQEFSVEDVELKIMKRCTSLFGNALVGQGQSQQNMEHREQHCDRLWIMHVGLVMLIVEHPFLLKLCSWKEEWIELYKHLAG
ncbi:hypothetical protein Tco_0503760 [Tanacetum coccineum]